MSYRADEFKPRSYFTSDTGRVRPHYPALLGAFAQVHFHNTAWLDLAGYSKSNPQLRNIDR